MGFTDRRMDGRPSQSGWGGGPRAHLRVSVVLYGEFMLGGLLNVLKLAGLPLLHSLHLGEEQAENTAGSLALLGTSHVGSAMPIPGCGHRLRHEPDCPGRPALPPCMSRAL